MDFVKLNNLKNVPTLFQPKEDLYVRINQEFSLNGIVYKCSEVPADAPACLGCCFENDDCPDLVCAKVLRGDFKDVIFERK